MNRIYVDHAATTPMHSDVIEKMTQTMANTYGNPSSIHFYGREARKIIDEARAGIARSISSKGIRKSSLQAVEQKQIIMLFLVSHRPIKTKESILLQPSLNIMLYCMLVKN